MPCVIRGIDLSTEVTTCPYLLSRLFTGRLVGRNNRLVRTLAVHITSPTYHTLYNNHI